MSTATSISLTLLDESGNGAYAAEDDRLDIDSSIHCNSCEGSCCRLTVMVGPRDLEVPAALTTISDTGHRVMARGANGFCVALGADHRCTIYEQRPIDCRQFTMGGPYCQAIRQDRARER